MPELWDTCGAELLTGSGASPRETSVLQSTKLKGVGDLKSVLTSDMEMQSLVSPDGFWSCCGPHYAPFPMFWNGDVYPVPLYVGSV